MNELLWYQRLHWRGLLVFLISFILFQIPVWLFIPELLPEDPAHAARRTLGLAALGTLAAGFATALIGGWYSRERFHAARRRLDDVAAERRSTFDRRDEVGDLTSHMSERMSVMRTNLVRLEEERGRLRALLKGMGEAVVMIDESEKILVANPVAERLLRLPDGYVGQRVAEACDYRRIADIVSEVLWSEDAAVREIDLPGKRGEVRHLTVSASPIIPHGVILGVVLVLTDVTRLRRLERVRRDFVANVSHELRTPIATIRSAAETLLLAELDLDDVMLDFLETIERNSVRMGEIVEDLLTLSRLEAAGDELSLTEVNLAPVFAELYNRCEPLAAAAHVDFEMVVSEDLPAVFVEEGATRQILQNLVENAIKYTPAGGQVVLRAKRPNRKRIRIDIADSGIGIPSEHLPRIFERFYRVDMGRSREVGGTGLGLAIVKHLVRKLKGRISVESSEGEGTTFTLWFRVYRPEKAS